MFDFHYANSVVFRDSGELYDIEPTEYDFHGQSRCDSCVV